MCHASWLTQNSWLTQMCVARVTNAFSGSILPW